MIQEYSSKLLENAVSQIAKFPSIGQRTALRLALFLLNQSKEEVRMFTDAITRMREDICHCKICHNISDTDICDICADERRNPKIICVVQDIRDVIALENTGQYMGLYHVLGGIISPMDGIGPSDIELDSLFERVHSENIEEVILALPATAEGDTTNFFIHKNLKDLPIKISAIARGVAIGGELEYADEVTLGRSLLNRMDFDTTYKR
ncbi:MAG: recombination protein RecR [Bacteroidales bacterium]|nr:recombination protein RecR [Bacteroidales bacterium]